jgi:hypothetical protein
MLGNQNDAKKQSREMKPYSHYVVTFHPRRTLFTCKLDLNLRKKLVKCYIWSFALNGAETWTLRKIDQKYLEHF